MEYNIFRDELAIKYPAYGHALWDPSPCREGLDSAVQVGDVGFTRDGRFIRLFNVLLPRDHPSHENFGVPEYHEPLKLKMSNHKYSSRLSPNNFCSRAVKPDRDEISAAEPGPAVTFTCSQKQGAILSLPVPAHREETYARGDFAKCITKHIDVWFAFARDLGLGVTRMEDIILVTGRDLARSWTNVVFCENQGEEQVSFGVQVTVTDTSDVTVRWQVSLEDVRGATVNNGPSGKNLPEDQSIFVRGFRVTRFLKIIPRLRGAAEPTSDLDQDEPESNHDKRVISTPSETDDPLRTLLNYLDQASII
ncbi:hypothetical protein BGW80DRAFT_1461197 [Lactifluus volemus]|nr:hypothetical protein BGW80DRAFT_1461197 [Lactifluus volemus]